MVSRSYLEIVIHLVSAGGEFHNIPPTIVTLEKSIVDRAPQQIFEVLFVGYEWSFSNNSGEKSNGTSW